MADPDTTGYSVRWDGEMRLTLDVFRDLGSAFAVAIHPDLSRARRLLPLVRDSAHRPWARIPDVVGVLPGHRIMRAYFTPHR